MRSSAAVAFLALAMSLAAWPSDPAIPSSPAAPAGKLALIIGGAAAGGEPDHHEFALNAFAVDYGLRAQGYRTWLHFAATGIDHGDAGRELRRYARDYREVAATRAATTALLDRSLDEIAGAARSGDRVEIVVLAHGGGICPSADEAGRGDLASACTHAFQVFDERGNVEFYPTGRLLDFLKRLEAKGALPTLVLDACHAGFAKREFAARALRHSCVFYATAGAQTGYGCFESDPPFADDFTAAAESVLYRYYAGSIATLRNHPYFGRFNCFRRMEARMQAVPLPMASVESVFRAGRRIDRTAESPSLSAASFPSLAHVPASPAPDDMSAGAAPATGVATVAATVAATGVEVDARPLGEPPSDAAVATERAFEDDLWKILPPGDESCRRTL